jgi:hypothetical protein
MLNIPPLNATATDNPVRINGVVLNKVLAILVGVKVPKIK